MGYLDNNGLRYFWDKIKEYIAVQKPYSIAVGNGEPYSVWKGTYAEYRALTPEESTIYIITTPPYDAEIEYLESSGTQYIQLACNVSTGTYFAVGGVIIPIYTSRHQDYGVFGAEPYRQFTAAFYAKNDTSNSITYTSIFGENGASGGWGGKIGTEVSFELSTTEKVVNGVHTSISRPLNKDITAFRIFGGYQNTNRYPIRIKSFYIKKGNDTLYNLIPVRIGQVGYMYDKISKQLFGNAGTSNFILGPDVT